MELGDELRQRVEGARLGNRRDFGWLVTHFQRRVYGYVARMVVDPDTASELAQDVFLKAWEAIPRFAPSSPFEPWLMRIARNRTYDHLRRHRIRPVDTDSAHVESAASRELAPDVLAERREAVDRIETALARLSDDYREAVVLRMLHGLSFEEIGRITGQSEGAAKARFVRARLRLREILR